jgi:hypothetical protein
MAGDLQGTLLGSLNVDHLLCELSLLKVPRHHADPKRQ